MPSRASLNLNLTEQEIERIASRVLDELKGHIDRIVTQPEDSAEEKRRRLITVKQAADKLGLSRDAFYRLRKEGLFREITLPIGGIRFDEAEIDRIIDELRATQTD